MVLGVLVNNMAIKAIIFDCFGVLVVAGHVLMHQDYPQFDDEFNGLQHQSDLGFITRQDFNESVARLTGLSVEEIELKYWSVNKFNQLTMDWVHELKMSGKYKIGMLSNISRDWMDVSLPVFEQQKLFDDVILSGDVRIAKPNPEIFRLMADKLAVQPNECVMIDDLSINIDGARLAGMQGIVYKNLDQARTEFDDLFGSVNA